MVTRKYLVVDNNGVVSLTDDRLDPNTVFLLHPVTNVSDMFVVLHPVTNISDMFVMLHQVKNVSDMLCYSSALSGLSGRVTHGDTWNPPYAICHQGTVEYHGVQGLTNLPVCLNRACLTFSMYCTRPVKYFSLCYTGPV